MELHTGRLSATLLIMFPVIASFAGFTLSSFGLFLLLGFLVSFFVAWRIIRLYDIDPEKIIDLSLLLFLGSIIGSRVYFVITHWPQFANYTGIIDLIHFPGLSFWGGYIGAIIVLLISYRKLKLRFWQTADLVTVGFFAGLALGSFGCLLGSCEYGFVSGLPIAVSQIGVIGKRFPVQIIQGIFAVAACWYLWKNIIKFHFDGQIAGKGLLILGLIKLLTEPFRVFQVGFFDISLTYFFSVVLFISGVWVLYNRTKKSLKQDLAYSVNLISKENKRKQAISSARKWWYNLYVNSRFSLIRLKRNLFKVLHVKSNPTKF